MVKDSQKQNVTSESRSKYEVKQSPELGRHLIAARDLLAGEAIHRERPVAVGPAAFFDGSLCFNCLKPVVLTKLSQEFRCTKCKVALLCQPACELITAGHHGIAECELFQRNQSCASDILKHPAVLLPLRLWLLRTSRPEMWSDIDRMEDHMKERQGTLVWQDRNENIVQVLQKLGLIPNDSETAKLLQHICGILDVNSFELRSPDNSEHHLLRGIYTDAALMAHDCRGNTHLTLDDEHHLTIYASMPIPKGAIIYFNYTASLLGTVERRENLRAGKYFECGCTLCRDPHELGSHLSSLICPRCRRGYVAAQNPLTANPYALRTKWQCERCKTLLSGRMIKTTLDLIHSLVEGSENSTTKALESLLKKLLLSIHTNHYLALKLKQRLLASYRTEMSSVHPQKRILERMLNLCKEVLVVLDIVEPGISRQKGIHFYEMHLSTAILANRSYGAGEISAITLASRLEDAERLLKKALSNLLLEPVATPEGRLAKRALHELELLRQSIRDAKALPPDLDEEKPKRRQSGRTTNIVRP